MEPDSIKCVVFDFAFTLCSDYFFKVTPPECPDWFYHFQRRVFCRHSAYLDDWMAGRLSSRDIADLMSEYLHMSTDRILEVMAEGCRNLEFNDAVYQFAQSQHRNGRRTALVTANIDMFSTIVVPSHGLESIFDVILNTYDYEATEKERLWRIAFELLGVDISFQNSLLIEDGPGCPSRFRELGGYAYEYTTEEAFKDWLHSSGFACDTHNQRIQPTR